jgi:hypothetical protein
MKHSVGDGITLAQTAGQKVRKRAAAVATGIKKQRHQQKQQARTGLRSRPIEVGASIVGAAAALLLGRKVRSRRDRSGR